MSSNAKSFFWGGIITISAFALGFTVTSPKILGYKASNPSQALTQNAGGGNDHHKPQPTNSTIFDALIGKQAPDFNLKSYDNKEYKLSDLKGKNVVLFFNEGLMCYPACWNQIAAFGKDKELADKAVLLNIQVDPISEWKQAVDKMPELSASTVLFDTNKAVSQAYGVLSLESSMHRGQFPGHTYVIIDKEGVIRFTKDDPTMATRNKEILDEVNKLQS